VGDSLLIISDVRVALSHAPRARLFIMVGPPGVPLRSTPGFMLSPRSAGLGKSTDLPSRQAKAYRTPLSKLACVPFNDVRAEQQGRDRADAEKNAER
jgi:hypothetical protein